MRALTLLSVVFIFTNIASSQVATGGVFTLEKSVVAGGGNASTGGAFGLASTSGQAIAGGPKTGRSFGIYSGFWMPEAAQTPSGPCPYGQGYWKNNPNVWPVNSLILGDETYTKIQLLTILNTPAGTGKKTDASLVLVYQLIAAKLNIANGVDPSPLVNATNDADILLTPFNGKLPYKVVASTAIGQNMVGLGSILEGFNKGLLTPRCTPPA